MPINCRGRSGTVMIQGKLAGASRGGNLTRSRWRSWIDHIPFIKEAEGPNLNKDNVGQKW